MLELIDQIGLDPRGASTLVALGMGGLFGLAAERSAFCLRRAVLSGGGMAAQVVLAMAVALFGTQMAVALGGVDLSQHRFHAPGLPILALAVGGLSFGAGMVLTRGCASRLTVLAGSGNLRAALVLIVFAVTAHATMKGVLAPLRGTLGTVRVDPGVAQLPGAPALWAGIVALVSLGLILRFRPAAARLIWAAGIGALVPLGWLVTGVWLFDDFDPIPLESLSITQPGAEAAFWLMAASAVRPGFGPGLIGGILIGALVSSLLARRFAWQSFATPGETGRYLLGGAMMGFGGVLAGGCSIGLGLSGLSTLSLSALVALVFLIAGARGMRALLNASPSGYFGSSARRSAEPAA